MTDKNVKSNFIDQLVQLASDIKTMVSVPAKDIDDPADDWSWSYNYKKIGKYADYVQVMTYDEHGSWSEPGSVASIDWMKNILTFATESISPEKVIMGVPAYGYDWNLSDPGQNRLIEWDQIHSTLDDYTVEPINNEETASTHFNYAEKNQEHVVWFEDDRSLQKKSSLTNAYGIAGVSVYALGHESESFWKAIEEGTKSLQ